MTRLYGVCDNEDLNVSLLDNCSISASFVTKPSPSVTEYSIFLYEDQLKSVVMYVCKLIVISYRNIDLKLCAGEMLKHSLLINGKIFTQKIFKIRERHDFTLDLRETYQSRTTIGLFYSLISP